MKLLFWCVFMLLVCFTVHFQSTKKQILSLAGAGIIGGAIVALHKITDKSLIVLLFAFFFLVGAMVALEVLRSLVNRKYMHMDEDTPALFCKNNVLILVPHQDDDINLCGGIIERYVKGGSDVHLVFYTNGDCFEQQSFRLREVLRVADFYKIPEKNVFFLGFGDQWSTNGKHIYNSQNDTVVTSKSGKTATYGLSKHKAYMDGLTYTRDHAVWAIETLLSDILPEVIYCSDFDRHPDHRALSMFFEEALGRILKNHETYHPDVYKGFAYSTAFLAKNDFYCQNFMSTLNPYQSDVMEENAIFCWKDRIRIPVSMHSSCPLKMGNFTFQAFERYVSQRDYLQNTEGIINGDKVFWKRRTDSLLYDAEVSCSSGEKSCLNDFKIIDTGDLLDEYARPRVVWRPTDTDSQKSVRFVLKNPSMVLYLCLYENASPEDNILDALIVINDGEWECHTGRLGTHGAKARIDLKSGILVKSIEIKILEYEGKNYGLSEVEAFSTEEINDEVPGKITDINGNFVYRYYVHDWSKISFRVYSTDAGNKDYYMADDSGQHVIKAQNGVFEFTDLPRKHTWLTLNMEKDGTFGKLDRVEVIPLSEKGLLKYRVLKAFDYLYIRFAIREQIFHYRALIIHFISTAKVKLRNRS